MFKQKPIYPLLFAFFPVLFLAAYNIQEIAPGDFVRPLVVSLVMGLLVFGLAQLLLHNWHRAGLITLLFMGMFFTYGQVYNALEDITLGSVSVFRHRSLLPLWTLLLLAGGFWIFRRVRQSEKMSYWLNLLLIFMLIYPIFTIVSELAKQALANRAFQREQAAMGVAPSANQPDIYYIILDGYGRHDILQELGYDNSEFLDALRQRGFYIADCSRANYPYTQYSLTSSLNYDYIDELNVIEHNTRIRMLKNGVVRQFLENNGYQTVAFPTGYAWSEWRDADIFIDITRPANSVAEFEWLVVDTTVMRIWSDYLQLTQADLGKSDLRRERTFTTLASLKKLPARNGNLFVFAHILIPHPPYDFKPDGKPLHFNNATKDPKELAAAYVGQTKFISREILQVVDAILAGSDTPPIIIIQGDHGPQNEISQGPERKLPILSAYYLPGVQSDQVLYPSVSPVNTFRIVLNTYFDQDLPLLEDRSYYAPTLNATKFDLVPNSCLGTP
jgi:hypothetical protein